MVCRYCGDGRKADQKKCFHCNTQCEQCRQYQDELTEAALKMGVQIKRGMELEKEIGELQIRSRKLRNIESVLKIWASVINPDYKKNMRPNTANIKRGIR